MGAWRHILVNGSNKCGQPTYLVPDYRLLTPVLEHGDEMVDGTLVLHLAQAVGKLVLQKLRVVGEPSSNGIYGLGTSNVS